MSDTLTAEPPIRPETSPDSPANPFIGTEAFRTGDRLFGRDREIVELTNRILARRVVVLHSPSGAGKTSLVQAGLIPALNRRGLHILPKIRLNSLPPEGELPADTSFNRYLFSALMSLDAGQGLHEDQHITYQEMARLSLLPDGLLRYLKGCSPYAEKTKPHREKKGELPSRHLLFFDQFEEILTLDTTDGPAKKDFFARLTPVLVQPHMLAIFAMREEYVAGLEPYLIYLPDRLSARFRLELLGQPEALEAIRRPAQRVKVSFHKRAAEQLVQELSLVTVREGTQVKKIPGPFVEPVQLQVVARDLFERRHDLHTITEEDVRQLGSVENALGAYYDKKIKAIAAAPAAAVTEANAAVASGEDQDHERRLRDWIEQELVIAGSLRGMAAAGEEAKAGLSQADINQLIAAFLVREEPRRGVVWYELAHDSLVRPIVASNAAWRELHASEFERQAARWNAASGPERERLFPPVDALRQSVAWGEARLAQLTPEQAAFLNAARKELQRLESRQVDRAELGLNLEDTGWGVIFAADAPIELRQALGELLDHRRQAATRRRPTFYREFFGANGYRPGDTAQRFLARFEAGSGPANPEKVPFYLLIVGGPQSIPFEFQYALDAQYAVGRIEFDTLEEYARYARSVVTSETEHAAGRFTLPNRLGVFATKHPEDRGTALTLEYLVRPVLEQLEVYAPNWQVEPILEQDATKANLSQVLGGPQTPPLLFTATNGSNYSSANPEQLPYQGSLVCQDYPGRNAWRKGLTPDFFFSGDDVPQNGNLLGTILLAFGAYIGGTPQVDNFPIYGKVRQIAPQPFLARLPKKLLSHPNGGALAVIAHVDQAWTVSFTEETGEPGGAGLTSDTGTFVKVMTRLIQGGTAGIAMEELNRRYSYFSSLLAEELIGVNFFNLARDETRLIRMMTQTIDARNFILIGDPAVRLPVDTEAEYTEPPPGWSRPAIGAVHAPAETPQTMEMPLPTAEPAAGALGRGPVAPPGTGEEPATAGAEPRDLGEAPAGVSGVPSVAPEAAEANVVNIGIFTGDQPSFHMLPSDPSLRYHMFRPPAMAIGRSEGNDLVLDDPLASRQHARLEYSAGQYHVTDLNTTNGTYLDNTRLLPWVPYFWPEGAVLRIGNTILKLIQPPVESTARPATPEAELPEETPLTGTEPPAGPVSRRPAPRRAHDEEEPATGAEPPGELQETGEEAPEEAPAAETKGEAPPAGEAPSAEAGPPGEAPTTGAEPPEETPAAGEPAPGAARPPVNVDTIAQALLKGRKFNLPR